MKIIVNVRRSHSKQRRLLQLYSLWQETRDDELEGECLKLLGQILRSNPRYRLRQAFRVAF